MRSMLGACLVAMCLGGSGAATLGCSTCATQGQEPVVYTEGRLNESGTIYETMGPTEEMLHFPEGRIYRIRHGMGVDPLSYDIYLSFRKQLTDEGATDDEIKPNNVSESAGNQAVAEYWDEEFLHIRNDTCAEFYMRAVIYADPDKVAKARAEGSIGAAGASGLGGADSSTN